MLTEAVVGRDTESDEDLAVRAERARKSNWQNCWKHMTLKDLTGWPLWEQELHDILEPAFSDLQVRIRMYACMHVHMTSSSPPSAICRCAYACMHACMCT